MMNCQEDKVFKFMIFYEENFVKKTVIISNIVTIQVVLN